MTDAPWENDAQVQPWELDPAQPSVMQDVAQSVPADVKAVGAGFAGTPGDLRDLLHQAGTYMGWNNTPEGQDWLSQGDQLINQKLQGTDLGNMIGPDAKILRPLTSEDVTGLEDKLTGGPSYQPQSELGKAVLLGSGIAGSALEGGEGLIPKIATRVVAPVAASEAGGALGSYYGPEGEQAGKVAGLLAGGPIAGLKGYLGAGQRAKSLIPTTEDLHSQASAAFKTSGLDQIGLNKQGYGNMAANLYKKMVQEGFNPAKKSMGDVKPVVMDIVKTLNNQTLPLTMGYVEQLRQQANDLFKIRGENAPIVHKYAHMITSAIDDYTHNIGAADIASGNPLQAQQATAMADSARKLWSRYKKAQQLDNIVTLAEGKAEANYTQAGFQTAVRQGVNQLLKKIQAPGGSVGWTKAEIDALKAARNPGGVGTVMKMLSNFSPRGWGGMVASIGGGSIPGVAGMAASALAPIVGPIMAAKVGGIAPLIAAGELGRSAGNALARRGIEHARDIAASGIPLDALPRIISTGGTIGAGYGANRILKQ